MNPLMKLISELESFLDSVKESMIYDLEFFINRESQNSKLCMLSFIYSFEDFKTVVYSIDKQGNTITDVVGLPIKNYDDLYAMENYGRFVPYEIEDKEYEILDQYESLNDEDKMNEYWNFSEEYRDKKSNIFKVWFMECWRVASLNTNTSILTSFAMHDSSGGIELTTGKYLTDDEIGAVFNSQTT